MKAALRPIHKAMGLLRGMPPRVRFRLADHQGSWAFVGPRWSLLDPASDLVLAYMSPVITPVPGERALFLSVCDTSCWRL
jgi:hypothetical protein